MMSDEFFRWDWVFSHLDDLWTQLLQHLQLTGMALGLGFVISLALTAVSLRWRRLYAPIAGTAGVLYTIPSLAAFALLLPLFGGLSGATIVSVLALASYTILILVRNMVTGIDGVPDDVVDAADGMGYRPARRFLRIELPLALPTIIAGVRIAAVTVIGLVTVTSLLGLGGLGDLILDGFRRNFPTMIITGTVASVILAAVVDMALLGLERSLTPWTRRG